MNSIVVSKNINSRYQTIAEALEISGPGDTILIEPGVYRESLTIRSNIEIVGNGSANEVIIESTEPSCLFIEADRPKISNLTFRGVGEQSQYAVYIDRGEPHFAHCHFSSTETAAGVMYQASSPIFESCSFVNSTIGLVSYYGARFTLKDCIVEGNVDVGVKISSESDPTILNTKILRNKWGVLVQEGGKGTYDGCEIFHNEKGAVVTSNGAPIYHNCSIHKQEQNIIINDSSVCILHHCKIHEGVSGVTLLNNSTVHILQTTIEGHEEYNVSIEHSSIQMKECQLRHANIGLSAKNVFDSTVHTTSFSEHTLTDLSEEGENSIEFSHCTFSTPKNDLSHLLEELHSYIGLEEVKNKISDLIDFTQITKARKELGITAEGSIRHHSLFLGNPGTGKTTIARILAKIYHALGYLESDHTIEVDRKDLVGEYIGHTEQKTKKILDDAAGGVLFIDEAYSLVKTGSTNDFGKDALDLILKRMEDDPSFIVIAAGYPNEMKGFIDSNPGLKDRFTAHFKFEDYTPKQLISILDRIVDKEEYVLSEDVYEITQRYFTELYRKRDRTFGNARMVRKFFEDVKMNHAKRCARLQSNDKTKEVLVTITSEDVESLLSTERNQQAEPIDINKELLGEALNELHQLVGLESVKTEIQEMITLVHYYIEEGVDYTGKIAPHTVFLGNPGTGKTTVARLLSRIYKALGILPTGDLIEATRQDLVAGHVGQTALKTAEILNSAMGSTLFIDEAYTLVRSRDSNDFGKEAIDTILKRMDDDRHKFSLIVAGYTEEMKSFLMSNPGLNSRFKRTIVFEDYSPEEMWQIARQISEKEGFEIDEDAKITLLAHFSDAYDKRDRYFSNGRFVRNVVEDAIKNATLRLADIPKEERGEARQIVNQDLTILFS